MRPARGITAREKEPPIPATTNVFGAHLKQFREARDRSRRWVEKQARALYPNDRERQICHSYLRQIEEGRIARPNPLKLKSLAEIYGVDYREVLAKAGYLDPELRDQQEVTARPPRVRTLELAAEMVDWLEANHVHPDYFINAVMGLTAESLHIVSRLVTTLSVHERHLGEAVRPAAKEPQHSP